MRSLLLLPALLLAGLAGAQGTGNVSAASQTYFITTLELSSGEDAQSQTYSLKPIFGNGILVDPDTASTFASAGLFALPGNFTSMVTAATTGSPAVTGSAPFFINPTGAPAVTLAGFDMLSGGPASVTVGGLPAVVTQQFGYQVAITTPDLDPGVHPVVVTNAAGSSRLEVGVGVKPMFYQPEPLTTATPVDVRFQGSPGDLIVLALGVGSLPFPVPALGARFGLLLDPSLVVVTEVYSTDAEGKWGFQAPPLPVLGQFYIQGLVIPFFNPSYAPWSWTNLINL